MDSILQLFISKTIEIQNNLLDLVLAIIEYEDGLKSGQQVNGTVGDKVLINKTIFQTMKDFLPKIDKNVNNLSKMVDTKVAENERLTEELNQCRRRESTYERQLKEVRNIYHNLKEEMEWNETVDQVFRSDADQTSAQKIVSNKSEDYLKTCLALISSSSQNQRTVQSFMEKQEVFREFMATIRTIFEDQIRVLLANNCLESGVCFDPNLIETIFDICINVFQCNDYSGEDIPHWIDCFAAIQALDKRFLKSSVNALHYICFAPNGTEGLQIKPGIIELLAKCLIDPQMKHEFKLKTNVVKVIRRMIDNSKDNKISIKLLNELIGLIPLDRFRQMTISEPYIQLKKGMAALLATISHFNSLSVTED